MQRIDWVDSRLVSWSLWRLTGTSKVGGYSSPAYNPQRVAQTDDVRAGSRSFSPTEDGCALEMDRAIASLPDVLKQTVKLSYTYDGGTELVALRLKITRATLHRRLCQADIRLADLLGNLKNKKIIEKYFKNNFATYT